jgi:hypothetical protein
MSGVRFGGLAGGTGALAFAGAMAALWVVLAAGPAYAVDLSVDRTDDPELAATPTADNCTSVADDCSLRGAITKSNALVTTDAIEFGIPDGPEPGLEVKTINGVVITGAVSATSNRVQGNFVGTDATGNSDLGNGEVGVLVLTPGNSVGGTATGARNVVSGNGGVGVSLLGAGADDNTVQGNFIGTDADGEVSPNNLGNFHGVFISEGSGNTVGGAVPAAANVISGNANHGVMVIGDTATGNSILRNSISENGSPGGLGIELSNGGVTPNDPRDPDAGPNTLQNFPVITSAGPTRIQGTLNSRPRKTFTVQLFSSPAPNFPTGFGEGETFLGEKRVATNRRGKASFAFTTTLSAGQVVTATATNAGGSTSEFSQARTVG